MGLAGLASSYRTEDATMDDEMSRAASLHAVSGARDAGRRFASDLFAVAAWAEECRAHAALSSPMALLSEASALSAACSDLLTESDAAVRQHEWHAFFGRLHGFVREASALIDLAQPLSPPGDRAALRRLHDLLDENADLVEPSGDDAQRALAAMWLVAARELERRFGVRAFTESA